MPCSKATCNSQHAQSILIIAIRSMSTICRFDLLQKQLDSCLDEQATGMILLFDQRNRGNNDHYLSQRQLCSQLT